MNRDLYKIYNNKSVIIIWHVDILNVKVLYSIFEFLWIHIGVIYFPEETL
jgi:hypothetical protein